MVDPFEARMKFTSHLEHLNASINSAQKAANYAIRNKDLHEDLHSCILEQIEKNNMNNRANIMYFIEQLCEVAHKEGHPEFIQNIQRDILRIVDAVAPSDGSGAANIKVVRRVLVGLKNRQFLTPESFSELEECLKERDTLAAHPALSPNAKEGDSSQAPSKQHSPSASAQRNGSTLIDKRQIEVRIEEDRERGKRLREDIWATDPEPGKDFRRMWDDASDAEEDDDMVNRDELIDRHPRTMKPAT